MASLTPSPQSVEDTFRNHLLSMTLGVAQTQLLSVAAELGIADLVKDGPRSIEALATELRDYAKFMGSVWLHQTWPHLPESVQLAGARLKRFLASRSLRTCRAIPAKPPSSTRP